MDYLTQRLIDKTNKQLFFSESEKDVKITQEWINAYTQNLLEEVIYEGSGLIQEIKPEYHGVVTVHEVASWQYKMKKMFGIK